MSIITDEEFTRLRYATGRLLPHEILFLLDELARLRALEGWRPIKSAPRDGTPILAFTPDDAFGPVTGIDVIWWDDGEWLLDGHGLAFQPTHWMPLPPPPQDSSRDGSGTHPPTQPKDTEGRE